MTKAPLPFNARKQQESTRIRQKVIRTLAGNSISLRRGRYLTKQSIQKRREKVTQHLFI